MPAMRSAVKLVFVLLATSGWWPAPASAFSADGHRVVGAIAESRLCAQTRAWLAPLLSGNDLASAGVWADAIRDDPAWVEAKAWHFIDVDDREPLARAMHASTGNVLAAIDRFEFELADRTLAVEKRAVALRFFVHFVADVHQPLHVGRPGDRGGNDIDVRWGEARMSLHELWDGRLLLASEGLGAQDLAAAVGALAVGQEAAWQASGPIAWAEESRGYRPLIYDLARRRTPARLADRYIIGARNVLSLRLAQAGVRLAGRLNRLGCPGPGRITGQAVEPAGPTH